MALQVELSPPGVPALRSGTVGSRNLRLLQPWAPDEAAKGRGHIPDGGSPQRTSDRRLLASVGAVEVQPGRPSAMLVMRQLLDAWRCAERELGATVDGSVERSQVQAQVAT